MALTLKNGLCYKINEKNLTARVTISPNAKGTILIEHSIHHQSNNYTIISIFFSAFKKNQNIESIQFTEDSDLSQLTKNHFQNHQ